MKYHISKTEFNCGIDLHAREMYVCLMNRKGELCLHCSIRKNDFDYFLQRVAPYRHDLTVVCECTFNWYWLADACYEAGIEFVLAHALYLCHIHGGKNKNDRIDSEKLAHLLRANLIPPAYVYPMEKRPVRALARQRMSYVWQRATLLTHLSMNQTAEGLKPVEVGGKNRDLWKQRLMEQFSDPYHRLAASCDLEMVRAYDTQIAHIESQLEKYAKKFQEREFNLLLSVPGSGRVLALTILLEMDSVARFPSVKDFVSYCRLVKGSVASAGKTKGMCGGKMGNPYLRWAFGEAAVIGKRNHPRLKPYAQRLVSRHGTFKGNAILACKLARAVYFMLQKGTIFDAERVVATSF